MLSLKSMRLLMLKINHFNKCLQDRRKKKNIYDSQVVTAWCIFQSTKMWCPISVIASQNSVSLPQATFGRSIFKLYRIPSTHKEISVPFLLLQTPSWWSWLCNTWWCLSFFWLSIICVWQWIFSDLWRMISWKSPQHKNMSVTTYVSREFWQLYTTNIQKHWTMICSLKPGTTPPIRGTEAYVHLKRRLVCH